MIHRALLGSLERFLGVYIEHTAGNFPLWLSPTQVTILPISNKFVSYSQKLYQQLQKEHIRTVLDVSNESLGKKIRNSEDQKIPYMIIVGQKELDSNSISVRARGEQDLGSLKFTDFLADLKEKIDTKAL